MLKKLTLALLLALPTYVSAAWGPGFYVGAGVGIDTVDFRQSAAVIQPINFNVANLTELAAKGVLADIFAGYGFQIGMFYLAGEVNANTSSADFNVINAEFFHHNVSETTYRINHGWGISALPGILLPETTLLYARIGYAEGRFHISTSDISLANVSETLNGVRFGVGIEKRLFYNLGARFEYSYLAYSNNVERTFDPVGVVVKTTIVSPRANQFEFGLVYRFS